MVFGHRPKHVAIFPMSKRLFSTDSSHSKSLIDLLKLRIHSLVIRKEPRVSKYNSSYIVRPVINSRLITGQLGDGRKVISETKSSISGFLGKYPAREKKINQTQLILKKLHSIYSYSLYHVQYNPLS